MIFDIEYASARVRVLRSKLLKDNKKTEIKEAKTKEELIADLDSTIYEQSFAAKDIDDIEDSLENNLIETIEKVISFLPKRYADDFNRYTLRFDLRNLKIMIRGINAKMKPEDIEKDITRFGNIYTTTKDSMPKDLDRIENRLEETPWHQAYKEGKANYKKTGLLLDLEHELDKEYMSNLNKIQAEPVKNFTKTYKQLIDIKTLSRLKEDRAEKFLFLKQEKKETTKLYTDMVKDKEQLDLQILEKLESQAR
ncbi:MAG: V-type ATPase subunit, partial [Actinomycetia bacterium]|nr:V-type ATPase subunit [Actinomycetes bacterium]